MPASPKEYRDDKLNFDITVFYRRKDRFFFFLKDSTISQYVPSNLLQNGGALFVDSFLLLSLGQR